MFDDVGIFIPTKGRLNNQKTYKILSNLGLKPILVIEPQEENEAVERDYDFIVLPEDNKGITYSRNFILKTAKNQNLEYICMIDDDISRFGYIKKDLSAKNEYNNKRFHDNNAFLDALRLFKEFKTCGTMQYTQFAWNQQKSIVYNKALEVVMFLYMPLLNNVWFEEDTIEDRDFSLDIILNHHIKTFRLNHLFFHCPSISTNKGGIDTNTRYEKQIKWAKKMENKWGSNICQYVIKKNGMPDIKINWRQVEKNINNKQKKLINDSYNKRVQLQFPFMKDFI